MITIALLAMLKACIEKKHHSKLESTALLGRPRLPGFWVEKRCHVGTCGSLRRETQLAFQANLR